MDNAPVVVNDAPVTTEPSPETGAPGGAPASPAPQPGEKTDPALLLKSLQQERAKVKELEEENERLKNPPAPSGEVFSDEGRALQGEITSLRSEISDLKGELSKKDLQASNPIFKDKWQEFEDFRAQPENKGMNLRTAAKAFLIENGLQDPPRKGLEQPTGGPRTPPVTGMTAADVEHLRKTNFRKYQELLEKGQLKIE